MSILKTQQMDSSVYEELDESKAMIEKLKLDCQTKTDLSETLKRSHGEQLVKLQEMSTRFENQARDLNEKTDQLTNVKQMYEEIDCRLKEKDLIIKNLSCSNEKLRMSFDGESRKLEEEKKGLVVALEKANERARDEELQVCAFKEEIEGLKMLLSATQKKCLDVEKKAIESTESRERDDLVQSLEEQNRNIEHELKWKKEQFKHLEEAHVKLQDQFQSSKEKWEIEKSNLVDDICSIQSNLDSQIRISQDLQSQLERCNQALAHEESRRKFAEVQLSESRTCFENAYAEHDEAKSKTECLTLQMENEIASLRLSLGTKDGLLKEMEYQSRKLEQENQELRYSLKEMQEAQIHQGGSSSSTSMGKLRNKIKSLELINRDHAANLTTKEAEWNSQLKKIEAEFKFELKCKDEALKEVKMELQSLNIMHKNCSAIVKSKEAQFDKMARDLNECKCELETKTGTIEELKMELESCHSSIMELKEVKMELQSLNIMHKDCSAIVKSKEAQFDKMARDLNECKCELETKTGTIEVLQMELESCQSSILELKVQSEETSLMLSVYKTGFAEAQKAKMNLTLEEKDEKSYDIEKEHEIAELKEHEIAELKERALMMECEFKDRLREIYDALDMKIFEGNETEFEKQIWKSNAERLKIELEESHEMRRKLEASLLAQIEVEQILKMERDGLQKEMEKLEERSIKTEIESVILTQIGAEKSFEHEKKNHISSLTSLSLQLNELKDENEAFLEANTRLSTERETILSDFGQLCDRISEFTSEEDDVKLMGKLEKIVQAIKTDEFDDDDETLNYQNENMNPRILSAKEKTGEALARQRSPFRELQLGG